MFARIKSALSRNDRSLTSDSRGQIGGRAGTAVSIVVSAAIALIITAALFPPALEIFGTANLTNDLPAGVEPMWDLLPLLGVLIIALVFIGWALLGMRGG